METLADLFRTFGAIGEKDAMIYRTGVRRLAFSYGQLYDLALRMNGLLASRGIGAGDRIVLWGSNSPWWGAAFWGIMARGAVAVPVDFMSGRERAETIAQLTAARLVIQSSAKMDLLSGYQSLLLEELQHLLANVEPLSDTAHPRPEQMAQLIYTSGTTGNPKGVILSHRNLMANLTQVNQHIPIVTPSFNFLSLLPLSHMFEQMGGFFIPLSHGATIVYLRTLKPTAIMEALAEEDIAAVIAVPRLLQLLKNSIEYEFEAKGLSGLLTKLQSLGEGLSPEGRKRLFYPVQRRFGRNFSLFVSGGAPLAPDIFRFWSSMGFRVVEGYGLTECSPVLSANTMDRQVPGSVGVALPGVGLRLEQNELVARGDNVFSGYYNNDEATAGAFTADGWFRTGDLGEMDGDGWLRIKGRSKELIVTGAGINVYPDEIESILNRLPGVREACVIGLDRGGGEEVHAVIIPDESGRPVDGIVAEANSLLDELHRITGFTIWPAAEFPKTTTLKIQKFKVKERLREHHETGGGTVAADSLAACIARITGAQPSEVLDNARLVTDLGLTSIGRLELVNFLEQEFRIDLDESWIGPGTRVADLREMVRKREKVNERHHLRFWANSLPVRVIRMLCDSLVHYPLLRAYVTLEPRGIENLGRVKAPVMFVANHLSYFDHPSIMFALPRSWRYRTATAAWAEFFFQNFKNIAQRLWKRATFEYGTFAFNFFPLPQKWGFRKSLQHMGKLADNGINILVFPEGERSIDGRMLPFRQGLGIMVKELGLPVVPVRIAGLEQIFPRGATWPRRGTVRVTFGEPIRFTVETPEEITARARRAVEELT